MLGPTLTQLQAALQAKGYSTDTVAQQTIMLNAAARRVYAMKRWPFLVDTLTVNTVAGNGVAALPTSGINQVDAVRAEQALDYVELDWADPEWVRTQQHTDRGRGEPRYWSRQGDEILLWPIPDSVFTLTVVHTVQPADLVAGADQAVVPYAFMDVIVWGAIQEMAFRQRDWPQADRAGQQYEARLAEMNRAFNVPQRQQPLTVQQSGFYPEGNHNPWLL